MKRQIKTLLLYHLSFFHASMKFKDIDKIKVAISETLSWTKISIFEIWEQESHRTGHVEIIGYQFGAKFKLVFCAKYDRGLDLGFWEILKPLKWTNITSFFLIKTNGWKDLLKLLFLCEFKCKKKNLQNVYFNVDFFVSYLG